MPPKKRPEKAATLRVVTEANGRAALEVSLPRNTTVKGSMLVLEQLDSVIEKLTGCPCLSGLDIRFKEHVIREGLKPLEQTIEIG